MFNALNRFISRLDGDPQGPKESSHGAFGFQVLRNTNLQLGIEPWFDFVVGINGRMIDNPDARLFAQEVQNCAGGTVSLGLWSAKGQRTRAMHIPVPADAGSLGLTLQWTSLTVASTIWHVLDVPANSPAEAAGLLPYGDYILGSPEGALHGEGGLGELVEDHVGRPLRLHVYNNEYDVTREVTIQPSRDWGGEGALGCVLGYGALHRLPAPLSEPVSGPGETLFDGDSEKTGFYEAAAAPQPSQPLSPLNPADVFIPAAAAAPSADFLVPAQMAGAAPVSAPHRSKRRDRPGHSPNRLMDDYLKEEEQKSRELDQPSSGRHTPVAPPPKAGGPPKGGPPRADTLKAGDDNGGGAD